MNNLVSEKEAKMLMADDCIDRDDLLVLPELFRVNTENNAEIPFDQDELEAKKDTHVLIYCPSKFVDGKPVSIARIRFNIEEMNNKEPCFYNQDWYLKEDFYRQTINKPHWLLLQKSVDNSTRGVNPEIIEQEHYLPKAVELTFAFFAYYFLTKGEKLWNHDYVWCSDRDNTGDQIYVGRYTDPAGINADGFEIHRHLSIKNSYGALL